MQYIDILYWPYCIVLQSKYCNISIYRYIVSPLLGNIILLCALHCTLPQCIIILMHSTTVHYNYNALCGGVHEICSTACSFDLRCESATYMHIYNENYV